MQSNSKIEDGLGVNPRIFEALEPSKHATLARAIGNLLVMHRDTCEAALILGGPYPAAAMTAVAELIAQFGAEELASNARGLLTPVHGEEYWNVQQMVDLADHMQRGLRVLLTNCSADCAN